MWNIEPCAPSVCKWNVPFQQWVQEVSAVEKKNDLPTEILMSLMIMKYGTCKQNKSRLQTKQIQTLTKYFLLIWLASAPSMSAGQAAYDKNQPHYYETSTKHGKKRFETTPSS